MIFFYFGSKIKLATFCSEICFIFWFPFSYCCVYWLTEIFILSILIKFVIPFNELLHDCRDVLLFTAYENDWNGTTIMLKIVYDFFFRSLIVITNLFDRTDLFANKKLQTAKTISLKISRKFYLIFSKLKRFKTISWLNFRVALMKLCVFLMPIIKFNQLKWVWQA